MNGSERRLTRLQKGNIEDIFDGQDAPEYRAFI
jgi:hypothetical protein